MCAKEYGCMQDDGTCRYVKLPTRTSIMVMHTLAVEAVCINSTDIRMDLLLFSHDDHGLE